MLHWYNEAENVKLSIAYFFFVNNKLTNDTSGRVEEKIKKHTKNNQCNVSFIETCQLSLRNSMIVINQS